MELALEKHFQELCVGGCIFRLVFPLPAIPIVKTTSGTSECDSVEDRTFKRAIKLKMVIRMGLSQQHRHPARRKEVGHRHAEDGLVRAQEEAKHNPL